MKKFLKSLVGLMLAGSMILGSAGVCTPVYADDGLALSCYSGGAEGTNEALNNGKNYKVVFYSPDYRTINDIKAAGFTGLEISYELYSYTADGYPGVMPFINFGDTWQDEWNDLKGSAGTVDMDIDGSWDNGADNAYFGVQFVNLSGTVSYKITSARLVGGTGGGNGGTQTGDTIDINTDVELNYAKLLQEALYFYDANMCGADVDENSLFSWRSDCHTDDAKAVYNGKTIDVSGGYHDAGDHVKFGLPAAFSATMLGISYMEYGPYYDELGLTAHYKRIMDRFADYFERCTVMENGKVQAFCYQVGEGNNDHDWHYAPEGQTGSRKVYFTSASDPCSDIVYETAAALALYSMNFNDEKSLEYAKALFEYAQNNPEGLSVGHEETVMQFYHASSLNDDKALAAAMLYKATGENGYKAVYNSLSNDLYCGWAISWDDVKALAALYAPDGGTANNSVAEYVAGSAASSKNSEGFVLISQWGSARYNTALQFMGLLADKRQGKDRFFDWAQGQMSYILGNNAGKHCFVTAYNDMSVKYPHHRAVYNDYSFPNCNSIKHKLVGALVGGPMADSTSYTDSASDYTQNEVALDYNACLVCSAAALYSHTAEKGTDEQKAVQRTTDISQIEDIELRTAALKGDVNGDGAVDDKDARLVMLHASEILPLADTSNADMNNDGKIDVRDVILILRNDV